MAVWSTLLLSELPEVFRLDAEYYQPEYLRFEASTQTGQPLAEIVKGVLHPVEISRVYSESGVRILLAQNIRHNYLDHAVTVFMPETVRGPLTRNRLHPGDVVMTRSGANFGDTACYLGDPADIYACADCIIIRPQHIPGGYLSTFFNCKVGRGLLTRGAYGAAQPHIAPSYLKELHIPRFGNIEEDIHALVTEAHELRKQADGVYRKAEAILTTALGLDRMDLAPYLFYEDTFSHAADAGRFDPEYYQPAKWNVLRALAAMPGKSLEEHFRSVKKLWQPNEQPSTATVRNYDLTDALTPFLDDTTPTATACEIKSTKKRFEQGDLVVSRLRSYLKEIAVVFPSTGAPLVGSTEFIVLRSRKSGLSAEALLVFLRSAPVQTVLKWCQDGSNHPRFAEKELLRLPVPDAVVKIQGAICEKIREAITARQESRRLLDEAKRTVEAAILERS